MSKKNVENFYEALANDAKLQEKVSKMASSPQVTNLIVSVAKEAGYDITDADLKEYAESKSEGVDTMFQDWNCVCYAAGSGHYKGQYYCGCFIGGGGKADPDGFHLFCVGGGGVTKLTN